MAYSIKYLFKFESSNGTTREIRVLKDGYSGDVIQRPLGRAPMLKKQQNGPVHGTSLEFYAECNVDREFIEFYTSNPKDYRVDLYAGSTLLWQGYITPELYSEPDIAPPYDVQVVATDGVGELKLYDYAAQGAVTLRTLLAGLLSRTGLGTGIYLISSLKPGSAGAGALLDMTINLDYMAGESCYDVLTYILDTLHATITWWKGAWILTRETNVTFTNGKVRYFNTAGNSALLNDSVQVLGKMYSNPAWPAGQLSTVIDPAKNKVTVQAPWHVTTCLQNPDMASDTAWTKVDGAVYSTDGYVLPQGSGSPYIRQNLLLYGIRVPMTLTVLTTALTSQITTLPVCTLAVILTYTVGSDTYYLSKDEAGNPVWAEGSSGEIAFQQSVMNWDSSRIDAEEFLIEGIPPLLNGSSFPAGTLSVMIGGYGIKVYSAHLDVVLPKGYQDILRLDNGARGEGDDVEIAIGRETADVAYYAQFLQGLLLDDGSLITSFSDSNFTTGTDYLAFIVRDYALSIALPRARVTGTVFLEGSVQIPPLVFTKGGLDYWVETWGWNLYEDELEISARTLPSASLTVLSETILESNGSTVSSAGGSGSSGAGSSMGGGRNYWEIDGTLNTLLKPKDAYSYVHSKAGLFFDGAALSGTVVPDLYVDTMQDSGGNPVRVLRTPLPLFTGGDQIIGDGTPGQGGGGGMPFMRDIQDVLLSATVGNGDLLQWNGSAWVNVAANTVGGVTSVVNQTGKVTATQIADALTGAGYKLTDTVITDYWKTGDTRTRNTVLAAPNGSNGAATFRALVPADIPSLAISKITNLQTSLDAKQDTISDLDTIRSNASNGNTAYNSLGNYVLKAGDTMTGDLIISKTGGGNLIIRGTEANHDGGTLYFYGRYYSSNPRNGAKIAAVYPGSGAYDIQDLVFYSSDNRSGDASPIWQEAMRIKSTKAVSVATSLAVGTTLSVSGLATLSGGATIPVNKKLTIGDAEIEWIPNSGNGYLRINKPLLTVGDQIVNSGTPGGGGGGGGASSLFELADVLTDANKTKVKQYDGTTNAANGNMFAFNGSKWYALKLGTNLSITNGTLNATDTTYSNGTGLALSNGVFSITSAYQTNIANGASAYSTLTTSQTKNKVLASPSSASGAPSFRALVAADIPSLTVSKISDLDTNYVSIASAQTVSAKHTFSTGLLLNTASSWSNTDRALFFSASDEMANLRYYSTDASKGLMFNPYSGSLKAGSFVKLGGGSGFLKADGSEDTTAYLPLAGGTMTGSIKLPNGSFINAASGYAICGVVSDGTTFYCGPGAEITSEFLLRSGNINLTHVKAGTNYTIWDASNSNLSTVDWAANNLIAAGIGTFDRVVLSNSGVVSHIEFTRAGWNYVSVPTDGIIAFNTGGSGSANTTMAVTPDGIRPGTKAVHSCGLPTAYWGSIYGKDLYLGGDTHNTAAGSIIFSEKLDSQRNGFKIAPVHATSANRINLVFYRSDNGTSPYAASWTTFMTLSYDGKVTIAGSLTTSGDQVISSDASLKTNWRDLKYGVADIAKATAGVFDWMDGKGESAGTKAQDWMHLVPQLVHGEEGHMTLAYGQIAMLNTILLARRSEDHETRIKALELENAELRKEIERLRS